MSLKTENTKLRKENRELKEKFKKAKEFIDEQIAKIGGSNEHI